MDLLVDSMWCLCLMSWHKDHTLCCCSITYSMASFYFSLAFIQVMRFCRFSYPHLVWKIVIKNTASFFMSVQSDGLKIIMTSCVVTFPSFDHWLYTSQWESPAPSLGQPIGFWQGSHNPCKGFWNVFSDVFWCDSDINCVNMLLGD